MLILTRREGETIFIGGRIAITITRISGGQVKVGIDAPPDEEILRAELCDENGQPLTNIRAADVEKNNTT